MPERAEKKKKHRKNQAFHKIAVRPKNVDFTDFGKKRRDVSLQLTFSENQPILWENRRNFAKMEEQHDFKRKNAKR